jgi:trk system potassium uptake protein TrkA
MAVALASDYLPATATKMARVRSRVYRENPDLLKRFHVDVVVSPEVVLAQRILRILNYPGARDVMAFEQGKVDVIAFRARKEWPILNRELRDLAAQFGKLDVIVGTILRRSQFGRGSQKVLIPGGKDTIQEGDLVYFLTHSQNTESLRELGVLRGEQPRTIVIGGGSEVAVDLAEVLSHAGYSTRLLVPDGERARAASNRLEKVVVLHADPADFEFLGDLLEEGVDTYISACGNDAITVLTALLAEKLGVTRSIVVTGSSEMSRLIKAIDMDSVLNPFELAASFVMKQLHQVEVLEVNLFAGQDAEAFEFIAPAHSPMLGIPLKNSRFPSGSLVAMIGRGDRVIIPRGDDTLEAGDRAIVFCRAGSVPAVERWVKGDKRR